MNTVLPDGSIHLSSDKVEGFANSLIEINISPDTDLFYDRTHNRFDTPKKPLAFFVKKPDFDESMSVPDPNWFIHMNDLTNIIYGSTTGFNLKSRLGIDLCNQLIEPARKKVLEAARHHRERYKNALKKLPAMKKINKNGQPSKLKKDIAFNAALDTLKVNYELGVEALTKKLETPEQNFLVKFQ